MDDRQLTHWTDISTYREELFGLSISSIVVFHYFENVSFDNAHNLLLIVANLYNKGIGSVGVDIFLFLSGFGIYYSLQKPRSFAEYIKRRWNRVVVPYLVVGFATWWYIDVIINHKTATTFLYDYSLLSFWYEGNKTFWYISFITILYLLAPLSVRLIDSKKHNIIIFFALYSLIMLILFFCFKESFDNIEIAIQRVPTFLLGNHAATMARNNNTIDKKWRLIILGALPLKIVFGLTNFAFSRMFNGIYGLLLIEMYIIIRKKINSIKVARLFTALGGISLELYLAHVAIRACMITSGIDTGRIGNYVMCILPSIAVAIVLSKRQKYLRNNEKR